MPRTRKATHYPRLRSGLHLLTTVYIALLLFSLLTMLLADRPPLRGMAWATMWASIIGPVLVKVIGARVVREFLEMVIDAFDAAIQRRETGGGADVR